MVGGVPRLGLREAIAAMLQAWCSNRERLIRTDPTKRKAMVANIDYNRVEEDFVAQVTDIAYQAMLRQGLNRSFLDVELGLWEQIRSAYVDHGREPFATNGPE
jgi:hypothetical protein